MMLTFENTYTMCHKTQKWAVNSRRKFLPSYRKNRCGEKCGFKINMLPYITKSVLVHDSGDCHAKEHIKDRVRRSNTWFGLSLIMLTLKTTLRGE